MTKIYFRADGNSKMGLGHVIRSLALVDMLKSRYDCIFIIREPSSTLRQQILDSCSLIIELKNTKSDLIEATSLARRFSQDDIVVLDGYHFDTQYQNAVKETHCKIVSIDDVFSSHFLSDIVINHSPGLDIEKYSVEDYTKLKLGVDYSLLRKPFLERGLTRRSIEKVKNVFVCFGGSDFNNITGKVVTALSKMKGSFKRINVVLGSAYLYEEELNVLLKDQEVDLIVHRNLSAEKMASLMESCQLAIVPSSSILYEVCSVGMYVISGYYVDNQVNVNKGFAELNLVYSVGDFNEVENLSVLFSRYLDNLNADQLSNQKDKFDGKSGKKLLEVFNDLYYSSFEVREASQKDCDQYFEWANDRSVRVNAINQEEIPYESHCAWFKSKIENANSKLFVLEKNGEIPVGQIRFDISNGDAVIGYSVAKEWRGKGLGKLLIDKGVKKLIKSDIEGLKGILAEVKSSNIPSLKIFKGLDFKSTSLQISPEPDLEVFKLVV